MHLRKTDAAEQQWMQWAQWGGGDGQDDPQVPPGLTLLIRRLRVRVACISSPLTAWEANTHVPGWTVGIEGGPQEGGQCQARGLVLREGCYHYWRADSDIVGLAPGVLLTNCMTPDKSFHLFLEACLSFWASSGRWWWVVVGLRIPLSPLPGIHLFFEISFHSYFHSILMIQVFFFYY